MTDRRDVSFIVGSQDARCAAWHLSPAHHDGASQAAPCVVMAHGFGGTRHMGLLPFAARFAQAGFHVLLFDYRGFGDSTGAPRQVLSVAGQLDDWRGAVGFARTLPGVDPDRIALWGTSLSGGHAIVTAAHVGGIAAVVAQVPMLDGRRAFRLGVRHLGAVRASRLATLALSDRRAARRTLPRRYVPIVGPPGKLAMLAAPDALEGVVRIADDGFVNEVNASCALEVGVYRPVVGIERVRSPLLLQVARYDTTVPVDSAELAARRSGGIVQLERYAIGHFDVYTGQGFERAVADQTAFLRRHLGRLSAVRP